MIEYIQPDLIHPRRVVVRKLVEAHVRSLVTSIAKHGLQAPVLVRPIDGGQYELIAGAHRLEAINRLGLANIPAIVRAVDDNGLLELAVIENTHRRNLLPFEEAGLMQKLRDRGFTSSEIGALLGKKDSTVRNKMRLLKLPEDIQPLVGVEISEGKARAMLSEAGLEEETIADDLIDPDRAVMALKLGFGKEERWPDWSPTVSLIAQEATLVCRKCPFFPSASRSSCAQCPLVEFLQRVRDRKAGRRR